MAAGTRGLRRGHRLLGFCEDDAPMRNPGRQDGEPYAQIPGVFVFTHLDDAIVAEDHEGTLQLSPILRNPLQAFVCIRRIESFGIEPRSQVCFSDLLPLQPTRADFHRLDVCRRGERIRIRKERVSDFGVDDRTAELRHKALDAPGKNRGAVDELRDVLEGCPSPRGVALEDQPETSEKVSEVHEAPEERAVATLWKFS